MDEYTECLHCGTIVVATPQGTCPECQQQMNAGIAESTGGVPQSLPSKDQPVSLPGETVTAAVDSVLNCERQFLSMRQEVLNDWHFRDAPDPVTADRIERDVIPALQTVLFRLRQTGQLPSDEQGTPDCLTRRLESWSALAEALRHDDPDALDRHLKLRKQSEKRPASKLKRQLASRLAESSRQDVLISPEEQRFTAAEFEQTLQQLTPRVFVTPAIVLVCVVVYVVMVVSGVDPVTPDGQSLLEWGADYGPLTMNGQWWRLLTSTFLHFGVIHLLFNMWVLLSLGSLVERLLGNGGFAATFLFSGVCGSIASLAHDPVVVSAGASGAVFGIVGALLAFLVFHPQTVPSPVLKELRGSMTAFIIYNGLFGLATPGIDMAAHIGGFLAGGVCGLILGQPLTVTAAPKRRARSLRMTVAGVIAVPLLVNCLPVAPPDIEAEFTRFDERVNELLQSHNQLLDDLNAERITEEQLAAAIEVEILPPWSKLREHILSFADASGADSNSIMRLYRFMMLHERSWQFLVQAIRENDDEKAERAHQLSTEADRLATEDADG